MPSPWLRGIPLSIWAAVGILSSTALTLLVLPVLYRLFHRRDEEERASAPSPLPALTGETA